MHSAGTAFLEALNEAGVEYLFANFGSDHPPIVEALAEARASGRPTPAVITCPNEMVALSAAHGYAQATGRGQAVLVHVECGTQALGGAVHNAARARIPALIFAGVTPFTQEGELPGSRNEWIQWIQDVADQRGIVRGYTKFDYEIRTGRNIKQVMHRALQLSHTEPRGPVYLMAAREVLEEQVPPVAIDIESWRPVAPAALPQAGVEALAKDLLAAERPLLVTSYVGRNPAAVPELVRLCERLGMGVSEGSPTVLNFPHDHPLYLGNRWGGPHQDPVLAGADLVLVLDSDSPWIPQHSRPRADAVVHHIDVDPLKEKIPLWYLPARSVFQADAETALRQLNAYLDGVRIDPARLAARRAYFEPIGAERAVAIAAREAPDGDVITPEYLVSCVRRHVDADTLVLSEGITNYPVILDHIGPTRPGSFFASGGSSLGWNGGAAIGMKLAHPNKTVIALTGDGSYMFSVPSTVHWMARQYGTPFLQVVFNNRGWKAPKMSALAVHPSGHASRANDIGVAFDPPPDYAGIAAAAGGAHAVKVERAADLEAALAEAIEVVRVQKRCAVLDVWLPHL